MIMGDYNEEHAEEKEDKIVEKQIDDLFNFCENDKGKKYKYDLNQSIFDGEEEEQKHL